MFVRNMGFPYTNEVSSLYTRMCTLIRAVLLSMYVSKRCYKTRFLKTLTRLKQLHPGNTWLFFPPAVPVDNSSDTFYLTEFGLTEQSGSNADFTGFILAYLLFFLIFIYLAASGLSSVTWDRLSLLWDVDSFFFFSFSFISWRLTTLQYMDAFSGSERDLAPCPGIEAGHWKDGVLATGQLGKSLAYLLTPRSIHL